MTRPSPLPEPLLERIAEQFRALAEPSRLRLMSLLFDGELAVGDLVAASGMSLANASKHLGILHQAGWVARRKDGVRVLYALADERTRSLCELMCGRVQARAAAEAALVAPTGTRRR